MEKKDISTIRKLGKPVTRISSGIRFFRVKWRGLSEITVVLSRRIRMTKYSMAMKLESIVATAAPIIPMLKPKMNSGSSAMFSTQPSVTPKLALFAFPSVRTRCENSVFITEGTAPITVVQSRYWYTRE